MHTATKHCPGCCDPTETLPISSFAPNRGRKDGVQSHCRVCHRANQRLHYARHDATERARCAKRRKDSVAENKRRVLAYLLDHPCVDCPERDPAVLEFDHRDPSQKIAEVAVLVRARHSWASILAEILKCDVRCANCHRKRHWRERQAS